MSADSTPRKIDLSPFSAEPSEETKAFNKKFEKFLAGLPPVHELPPSVTRQAREDGKSIFPPAGPLEGSEWWRIPGYRGRDARVRVSMPDGEPEGVYLHVHGGGWTLGSPAHFDLYNQKLAKAAGVAVASIEYRLAPEDPWPAGPDDVWAAALWLLVSGKARFGTDKFVIGGESAGAHLVSIALQRAKYDGMADLFRGAVLTYGCFDLCKTPSLRDWGERKLVLSTPTVDWFSENFVPDREKWESPEISTIRADVSGMPPALFQVGTMDPLLDDTLIMAKRWLAAGNEAELLVYPGGIHTFDMFDIPIAHESHAATAEFVKSRL